MAPDVAPIERLEDHPITVDPQAIEEEFAAIWRETAGAGIDESTTRVRVLNLVAVGESDDDAARFDAALEVVPQAHPCRGILALLRDGPAHVDATLSARCWRVGAAQRHVCSEEVLLTSGRDHEKELASLVRAVVVPEVPVALWTMAPPDAPQPLAGALMKLADRFMFDTDRAEDLARAYASIAQHAGVRRPIQSDLAWTRLASWRELTAQFFDGGDGARVLRQISSIQVVGGQGRVSSSAVLHAAWLTANLGLTIADANAGRRELHATLYAGSRSVHLSAVPGAQGSHIESVRIVTGDAEFVLECHAESGHVHVREQWDGGANRRVVAQPPADEPSTLARTLDGVDGGARLYNDAVTTARSLLER